MGDDGFKPFIPPEKSVPEFTFAAVAVGVLLSVILCAANVYLGLMAGMTVSASIPAAVISMGILRGILRRGTILENNVVQTIASAGESIAAGVIFTIPAIVMAGLWSDFKFWPTFLVGLLGGFLGILFMVPLRKTLIVEEKELTYPEGVACAEILETGQRGGSGITYIFGAMGIGIVYTLLEQFTVIASKLVAALRIKKIVIAAGTKTTLALVSIGYILGLNVSILVFTGGAIAWFVAIPIYMAGNPYPPGKDGGELPAFNAAMTIWDEYIRYMGAGAMVVGGLWSIWRMRKSILSGIGEAASAVSRKTARVIPLRTDRNLPMSFVMPTLGLIITAVFFLYWNVLGSAGTALLAAVVMVVTAFLFVAVSSYIVGLVGSSNNPVSGMTIFTLLIAITLLLLIGIDGNAGKLAALVIAGVVCCAACAAGDMSQDLKTGHLVGATPKMQQIGQLIGVVVASCVTAPVLMILNHDPVSGKGVIGTEKLSAPQASMFKNITESIFGGNVPWEMLFAGAGVAVVLIILDEFARMSGWKFRLHVMPVAVGIYLPVYYVAPILIGGIIRALFGRKKATETDKGILAASGLIAGEALMGIVIAAIIFFTGKQLPVLIKSQTVTMILGALAFAAVVAGMIFIALRGKREHAG